MATIRGAEILAEDFAMENGVDVKNMDDLDDETLQVLYTWIDEIPLSRPKRNIARDFSDGGKDVDRFSALFTFFGR